MEVAAAEEGLPMEPPKPGSARQCRRMAACRLQPTSRWERKGSPSRLLSWLAAKRMMMVTLSSWPPTMPPLPPPLPLRMRPELLPPAGPGWLR